MTIKVVIVFLLVPKSPENNFTLKMSAFGLFCIFTPLEISFSLRFSVSVNAIFLTKHCFHRTRMPRKGLRALIRNVYVKSMHACS